MAPRAPAYRRDQSRVRRSERKSSPLTDPCHLLHFLLFDAVYSVWSVRWADFVSRSARIFFPFCFRASTYIKPAVPVLVGYTSIIRFCSASKMIIITNHTFLLLCFSWFSRGIQMLLWSYFSKYNQNHCRSNYVYKIRLIKTEIPWSQSNC